MILDPFSQIDFITVYCPQLRQWLERGRWICPAGTKSQNTTFHPFTGSKYSAS